MDFKLRYKIIVGLNFKEKLDGIVVQAKTFEEQNHFKCEAIKAKEADLTDKYQKLQVSLYKYI